MWKPGDPEMATAKRVRTYRPKHSDTSLSREWRINMANKKNIMSVISQALIMGATICSRGKPVYLDVLSFDIRYKITKQFVIYAS